MQDPPSLTGVWIAIGVVGVIAVLFGVLPEWRASKRLGMRSLFALLAWGMFAAAWLICPLGLKAPAPWADTACGDLRAWLSIALQLLAVPFAYLGLTMRVTVNTERWGTSWWWRRYER